MEGTCTCFTSILVLRRARLGSLVEEHHTATVHNVCLHDGITEQHVRMPVQWLTDFFPRIARELSHLYATAIKELINVLNP